MGPPKENKHSRIGSLEVRKLEVWMFGCLEKFGEVWMLGCLDVWMLGLDLLSHARPLMGRRIIIVITIITIIKINNKNTT